MRIFVSVMCAIGGYFAFGFIISKFFQAGIDVPMVEASESLVLYSCTAVCALLAWAAAK